MRFLPNIQVLLVAGCLIGAGFGANQPPKTPNASLLPQDFAGWQMQGSAQTSTDPRAADSSNAAILREYRFATLASASYSRDDGRTLKIRAARFADASGAFGAYTFYLQPDMTREQIGDQAASSGQHVLFYRGDVLVDAVFSQETAMSGAELRELAGDLPRPSGSSGNLPTFIQFMPRQGYVPQTEKYVMGPAALAALTAPIGADLVDFGASSEVTLGRYNTPSGNATLMLVSYPTPQLAAEHLKRIDAAHHLDQPQEGVSSIESASSFFDKRTGPIIAIASGPISDADAKSLLGKVNYEASVTWNTPAANHEVHELYSLVLNIVVLCAIIGGLAIIAGFAFGGFRVLMKKLYPDRVFDRPEQMEFISLHLTETVVEGQVQTGPKPRHPARQNPA
jgi:hypothetical protein